MSKRRIFVGEVRFDPRDATKNRGHEYGKRRHQVVMRDKRHRRRKTRAAQLRDDLRSWGY